MIRLAVFGDEALARELAPRLRGAAVDTRETPDACDAVLLVETNREDAQLALRCLSAGKHVLLTAQAWLSSDVLAALSAAARNAGVQLAVANPDRFLPSRQLIRQQLDAGKLGEPGLIRVHRWEPAATSGQSSELPTPLLRDLDLALWLCGKPPDVVYAVEPAIVALSLGERERCISRSEMTTVVQVHLGFPGGGMALVDYADRLPPGEGYQSLSVIGSAGAAYADDHQNMQLVYRGGGPQGVLAGEQGQRTALMTQDFVDGLTAGRDFSPSVLAWQNVLTVADAVRESLASRRAVVWEGR